MLWKLVSLIEGLVIVFLLQALVRVTARNMRLLRDLSSVEELLKSYFGKIPKWEDVIRGSRDR